MLKRKSPLYTSGPSKPLGKRKAGCGEAFWGSQSGGKRTTPPPAPASRPGLQRESGAGGSAGQSVQGTAASEGCHRFHACLQNSWGHDRPAHAEVLTRGSHAPSGSDRRGPEVHGSLDSLDSQTECATAPCPPPTPPCRSLVTEAHSASTSLLSGTSPRRSPSTPPAASEGGH